jgi:hypothetical protein
MLPRHAKSLPFARLMKRNLKFQPGYGAIDPFRHRRDAYDTFGPVSAARTSPSPTYHRRPACVLILAKDDDPSLKADPCRQSCSPISSAHLAAQTGRL